MLYYCYVLLNLVKTSWNPYTNYADKLWLPVFVCLRCLGACLADLCRIPVEWNCEYTFELFWLQVSWWLCCDRSSQFVWVSLMEGRFKKGLLYIIYNFNTDLIRTTQVTILYILLVLLFMHSFTLEASSWHILCLSTRVNRM